jgi:hypothetical protein
MERITLDVLMYRPKITAPQLTGLVLGHIFLELDEPHSGEFLVLHSKELKDSLMVLLVGVDGDEEQLALVFLEKNYGTMTYSYVTNIQKSLLLLTPDFS